MSVKRCILRFFAIVLFVLGMQSVAMACDSYTTQSTCDAQDSCMWINTGTNSFCSVPEFTITTTDTSDFSFTISAAGTYYLDCGNGEGVRTIDKTSTDVETITCTNRTSTIIGLSGDATGYNITSNYTAAISFSGNTKIKKVDGSLGAIFSGSAWYMFYHTFSGCTSLESIPETLFAGVSGSALWMFHSTFSGCTSLESIPENLFSGITGSTNGMFQSTFSGCRSLESIPENLFAGISGSAAWMFSSTFQGCTSLTEIPENLFAGVSGSAYAMFSSTFYNCTSLTEIPENLFNGISGSADNMFSSTFWDCTSLTSIPENLFAGVSGSANYMFYYTFRGCTSLTSIPENLFAGISGSAAWMFSSTFDGCTSLTSIPENLFAGVSGSARQMFSYTFDGCTSLESIPENLFAGVSGSADYMFADTFRDCTSLTSIPENLFAGVSGSATYMFDSTFFGCKSLTSLPDGLFKNIEGKPANSMFEQTFYNCTNLSGYIPANTFEKMDSMDFNSATMTGIFNGTALDTTCPDGTYQYITGFESAWSGKVSCASCPDGYTSNAGATSENQCYTSCTTQCTQQTCPDNATCTHGATSTSGKQYYGGTCDASASTCSLDFTCKDGYMLVNGECIKVESEFFITTTSDTKTFTFTISAAGSYTFDWGDGNIEQITKSSVGNTTYSHTYDVAGEYVIGISGQATRYSTDVNASAIRFSSDSNTAIDGHKYIAAIDGSLGKIFGTLPNGKEEARNPRFRFTFGGCSNLSGTIPEELFDGIEIPDNLEKPLPSRMFHGLFNECKKLSGSIPEKLFANIKGNVTERMFQNAFYYCESLTGSIPENLFAGIKGAPAPYMFMQTFRRCAGLTGPIPKTIFGQISGAPATQMMYRMFRESPGLTGYVPLEPFQQINQTGYKTGPMTDMFLSTGLEEQCPANEYESDIAFKIDWSGKVACETCPDGYTSNAGATSQNQCFTSCTAQCVQPTCPDNANCSYGNETASGNLYYGADSCDAVAPSCSMTFTCKNGYSLVDGKCAEFNPDFTFTTVDMPAGTELSFSITASGSYYIDCDNDEPIRFVDKQYVSSDVISCYYPNGGVHTVKISGQAEDYSAVYGAAISFSAGEETETNACQYIDTVDGSLGAIFNKASDYMFYGTFENCSKLKNITQNLFGGITGSAAGMFYNTFRGCTSVTSIPGNLFAGVSGSANYMFDSTFEGCTSVTTIPENLFAGITGGAENMFQGTFKDCLNLQSIPEGLFGNISNAEYSLFHGTFAGCTSLAEIPPLLFEKINTVEAGTFYATFRNCTGLQKLPDGLFKNIYGDAKFDSDGLHSFAETFSGCTNLKGYVPVDMFQNLEKTNFEQYSMWRIFDDTDLDTSCPAGMHQYITGFESAWDGKVSCTPCPDGYTSNAGAISQNQCFTSCTTECTVPTCPDNATCKYGSETNSGNRYYGTDSCDAVAPSCSMTFTCNDGYMLVNGECVEPEFTITTTEMSAGTTFNFSLYASGVFYIDFDDGNGVQKIDRTDSIYNKYHTKYSSAEYTKAGTHTIKIYGDATGYDPNNSAISFAEFTVEYNEACRYISAIDGSLGAIFGGNAEYMFSSTFQGCTSLTEIPENLFTGVSGSSYGMFWRTFSDCTSLTEIPEKLFAGISGSADMMFSSTFEGCTSLTSIPENLFSGVSGNAYHMFGTTFAGCTSLTEIPENLFTGVSGYAYEMFRSTFYGCTGLRGYIPPNTFPSSDVLSVSTMSDTFTNTTLDEVCPAGMHQYITGFESEWSGKVSCASCPESHPNSIAGNNGTINQCFTSCTTECTVPTCPDNATCKYGSETASGNLYYGTDSCDANAPTCSMTFTCNDGYMLVNGECIEPEFTITTTDTSDFSFKISAVGTYYLDCGNGEGVRTINKTRIGSEIITCTNRTSTTIGLSGDATEYFSNDVAAISFENNTKIKSVDGSLGAIFGGSSDYMFADTFYGCTSLTSIPENLFAGVSGSATFMFSHTFYGCTSLTGIPEKLFEGVSDSAYGMFYATFDGCTSLESIPENLFKGVSGSAEFMFSNTFSGCTSLTYIPENLFTGVTDSAVNMFYMTFAGCTSLESIPENLFAGVSGSASDMYSHTFYGCTSLTSIPENLFAGVNGSAEYMFGATFRDCTSLTSIHENLFAGVSGSAYGMFYETFSGCTSLESIPENLFAGVSGSATFMFYSTFSGCTSLESIPSGLFDGVTGTADFMFAGTFANCTSLTKLPNGLFKNITGEPRGGMFRGTFAFCDKLSGYIPSDTFALLSADGYMESKEWIDCLPGGLECSGGSGIDARAMDNIFVGTNLYTQCPANYYQYITGFEDDWSGKVSCTPCPDTHPDSVEGKNSTINQCYTSCTTDCMKPECPGNATCTYGENPNAGDLYYGAESCDATALTCPMGFECNTGYIKNSDGTKCVTDGYIITYELNGGVNNTANPDSYTIESETIVLANPTRDGYTFTGWTESGTAITEITKGTTGNKTLVAKWERNTVTCDAGYYLPANAEVCELCLENHYCYGGTFEIQNLRQGLESCPYGLTSPAGAISSSDCHAEPKSCAIDFATQAYSYYDHNTQMYGKCIVIECESSYHIEANACVPDEISCNIQNGTGIKIWNEATEQYGTCTPVTCQPGYLIDENQCAACDNMYDENGDLAVSTYVAECEIAACLYQGEKYTLDNNECVPICETKSDYTGHRYWNGTKCVHECEDGYTTW